MKKERILSIILVVIMLVGVFTGCNKQPVDTITETVVDSTETVTVAPDIATTEGTTSDAWPYGEYVGNNEQENSFETALLPYDEKYENFAETEFPTVSGGVICLPSSTKFESTSIQEVFTKEQLTSLSKTYCDVREWEVEKTEMGKYTFSTQDPLGVYPVFSMSGEGKIYYFFISSPDIPIDSRIDDKEIYYDETTKTLYFVTHNKWGKYNEVLMEEELYKMKSACCLVYLYVENDFEVENVNFVMPE